MVRNGTETTTGDRNSVSEAVHVNESAEFSDLLSVLSHRTNRRILTYLVQEDDPVSVGDLTMRVAEEGTPLMSDGADRTRDRTDGGSSPQ